MNSETTTTTFPSHLRKRLPNRVRQLHIGLRKMIKNGKVEVRTGITADRNDFLSKILTCYDFSPQILDSSLPVTPISKALDPAAVKSCPSVTVIPVHANAPAGPRILVTII